VRRFTIEVDEEVFASLEAEARSRIETHNTVLRRKLFAGKAPTLPAAVQTQSVIPLGLPNLPPGTPAALQQILWVVQLVRANTRDRPDATADVAKVVGVTPQTVTDKYGRQLGLTADRFDELLREASLEQLEKLLRERFSRHHETIARVLTALRLAAQKIA
jgi:hypothetical protein